LRTLNASEVWCFGPLATHPFSPGCFEAPTADNVSDFCNNQATLDRLTRICSDADALVGSFAMDDVSQRACLVRLKCLRLGILGFPAHKARGVEMVCPGAQFSTLHFGREVHTAQGHAEDSLDSSISCKVGDKVLEFSLYCSCKDIRRL